MRISLSTSLLLSLAMNSALAVAAPDQVLQRNDVSLAMANDLLNAALTACHADGRTGVAAIVDRGGNLVALQRDDNVGPHNTLAAQRKAYTALSTKTPTRLLAERARNTRKMSRQPITGSKKYDSTPAATKPSGQKPSIKAM